MAFRPNNTITTSTMIVGNPVTGGSVPSVLTVEAPGILGQTSPTIANTYLGWDGAAFIWTSVTGFIAIGDPVAGGNPNAVLFIDAAGNLADDVTEFSFIPTTSFHVQVTNGTYNSEIVSNASSFITNWTDGTVITERRQGVNFIKDTYTGSTSNQSIMNLLNSSAQLKHTDSGSGVTSQLTLSGTISNMHYDDGAVSGDLIADSSGVFGTFVNGANNMSLILTTEATLDFTDGAMDSYFQANATQAKAVFDDGSSTTATMLLDVTQVDLRFINALSQTSYVHGEAGQMTIRTDDPSGLSQSFSLYLTDSATMRWRLTPANSANGIVSIDSNLNSTYLNYSDGIGSTASVTATSTDLTHEWTDSANLTTTLVMDGTHNLLSFVDSSQNDRPTLEQGTHFIEGKVLNISTGANSDWVMHSTDLSLSVIDGTGQASLITLDQTSSTMSFFDGGFNTGNTVHNATKSELYWEDTNIVFGGSIGIADDITNFTTTSRLIAIDGTGNQIILVHGNQVQMNTPKIVLQKTITPALTVGAQTIDKPAGSVNFAALATSLVITNNTVTANSVVIATVATNDATMTSVQAVAGANSITLFANAAPTAETRVNFLVIN